MSTSATIKNTYRLPDSVPEDLETFRLQVEQFQSGAITADQFKAFRVIHGIYEQRESGRFMMRLRLPGGALLPHQMRALADAAERFGDGVLHVTSRQNIQVHRVAAEHLHPAAVALAAAGLWIKGGGGNTVRNITACPHAGVCPHEAFDVTPHVIALTEALLPDPASYQLPRKYKIACSGCAGDCAAATVQDLGFIAKVRDGQPGFSVWAGGGMGGSSRVGQLLEEFITPPEALLYAEAVKRVFHQHGNRQNRSRARIRFLVEQVGFEGFRGLVNQELAALRQAPPAAPLPEPPAPEPRVSAAAPQSPAPGFAAWRAANTVAQKQPGWFCVSVPIAVGLIPAAALRALAAVAERFGEGQLRAAQSQNVVLRWIAERDLPELQRELDALGLAAPQPPLLRDLVACTSASTCRLGICLSRGLAQAIADELARSGIDLFALGELKLNISGCPNSCGRHQIADIGLQGAARRVDGRMVPAYAVQLGGFVREGETRLAQTLQTVPARHIPAFLRDLLRAYAQSGYAPDFPAFLENGGRIDALALAGQYQSIPSVEADPNFYYDWGATEPFAIERG